MSPVAYAVAQAKVHAAREAVQKYGTDSRFASTNLTLAEVDALIAAARAEAYEDARLAADDVKRAADRLVERLALAATETP